MPRIPEDEMLYVQQMLAQVQKAQEVRPGRGPGSDGLSVGCSSRLLGAEMRTAGAEGAGGAAGKRALLRLALHKMQHAPVDCMLVAGGCCCAGGSVLAICRVLGRQVSAVQLLNPQFRWPACRLRGRGRRRRQARLRSSRRRGRCRLTSGSCRCGLVPGAGAMEQMLWGGVIVGGLLFVHFAGLYRLLLWNLSVLLPCPPSSLWSC